MAHELEIKNGKAQMMYVGDAPWHKLGTPFTEPPTLDQAIIAAGLDWQVFKMPLQTVEGGLEVPAVAIARDTDKRILGVVGPDWNPLQNSQAFQFFKPFIDSKEASINTAGSLKNGQRVFVLAKINRDPMKIVGDDTVEKYILLSNSHDGTQAVRVGFTPIRVVCANTLAMAQGDHASKLLRVRHTKNLNENLANIQEIMNAANAEFEATAEMYRAMASKDINGEDLKKFVKLIFVQAKTAVEKKIEEAGGVAQEVQGGDRILERIVPLFESGRGNDMPGVKGTLWGAYNAVTEYIQYQRGNNDSTRLDQTWFGQGHVLNKRALEVSKQLLQNAA